MKKIYETPAVQVVTVELQNMVAASPEISKGGSYSGQSIESRDFDDWDEKHPNIIARRVAASPDGKPPLLDEHLSAIFRGMVYTPFRDFCLDVWCKFNNYFWKRRILSRLFSYVV